MICWKCKKEIELKEVVRSSECPFCHADLHSCKGCKYYAPGSHFDCHETVDELISDKDRSNFCDYFSVADIKADGKSDNDKAAAAKNAFNALFGD